MIDRRIYERIDIHTQAAEDILDVGAQFVERGFLLFHHPGLQSLVAGDPYTEVHLFGIGAQRIDTLGCGCGLSVVVVAIAELVEFEVGILAVGIALDTLQSAEEQGLTHHAQILRKRVHYLDARIQIARIFVVCYLGERVVEDLVEALRRQLLAYTGLQALRVGLDAITEVRVQFVGELHVVITVYTEYILDHIALALHIHTVAGHT